MVEEKGLGPDLTLMAELESHDLPACSNFMRIPPEMLNNLQHAEINASTAEVEDLVLGALSPGLKLEIILRHLATGESFISLMFSVQVQ